VPNVHVKTFWSIAVRILFGLFLSFATLFLYGRIERFELNNTRLNLSADLYRDMRLLNQLIEYHYQDYASVLYLIRNSEEFGAYLEDPNQATAAKAEALFSRIGINRDFVIRVAYLDLDGLEKLSKVVRQKGELTVGWSEVFWKVKLSENYDQPFFSSMRSIAGTIGFEEIISVIDCALPVYFDGKLVGILAMAIDGAGMISLFDRYLGTERSTIEHGILDDVGRWIYYREKGASRGYPEDASLMEPVTFTDPALWRVIATGSIEELQRDESTILIHRVRPQLIEFYNEGTPYWTIVSKFDESAVEHYTQSVIIRNRPLKWVVSLFMFLISTVFTLLFYFRKADKQLIRIGTLISEHVKDGVVILNGNARISYCNTVVEQITGYDRIELTAERGVFRTLDTTYLTSENFKPLADDETMKAMAWIDGKGFHTLVYLAVRSITGRQDSLSSNIAVVSLPANSPIEAYRHTIEQSEIPKTHEIDQYPCAIFSGYLKTDIVFRLWYVKISNIATLESSISSEHYHTLLLEIANRLHRVVGLLDMFRLNPDTYLLGIRDAGHPDGRVIASVFENLVEAGGKFYSVRTVSGVSLSSTQVDTCNSMLLQARMALAILDHLGTVDVQVYDEEVNRQVSRYFEILERFPDALKNNQIRVAFQPIVDVRTHSIVGAEALSRWDDAVMGVIPPDEFIPIIQHNNQYNQLSKYVLSQIIAFLRSMNLDADSKFSISINTFPEELEDSDFIDRLVTSLARAGIGRNRIRLEITENSLVKDLAAAGGVVSRLRKLGFAVEIDDFGTGFSSLSYLRYLMVDVLKIDRSFLIGYPHQDNGSLFKAIVGMAKDLGMTIIAEGVENKAQLELLESTDCEYYQGYLFAKALTPKEFMTLYAEAADIRH